MSKRESASTTGTTTPAPKEVEEVAHEDEQPELPHELPILPMRQAVLFPGTVVPLSVGRPALHAVTGEGGALGVHARRRQAGPGVLVLLAQPVHEQARERAVGLRVLLEVVADLHLGGVGELEVEGAGLGARRGRGRQQAGGEGEGGEDSHGAPFQDWPRGGPVWPH